MSARVSTLQRLRALGGLVLLDIPREVATLCGGGGYNALHNRGEQLIRSPDGLGYKCDWEWTSELRATSAIPVLGRLVLRAALREHPFLRSTASPRAARRPEISFVIGHRGTERLPLVLATIASIAAQQDISVEIVVVEQSPVCELAGHLPSWVKLVHARCTAEMPYNRAWAFNIGARVARADILVLHDGDILIPARYAATARDVISRGFDVANLKRFVFYLNESSSRDVLAGRSPSGLTPESVIQNLEGGGSVAISSTAFDAIGGMDEGFVKWGGEDNEFWDRCNLLRRWDFGSLPLIHLWHPAHPAKLDALNPMLARYRALRAVPPASRVERLRSAVRGGASPRSQDVFADICGKQRCAA